MGDPFRRAVAWAVLICAVAAGATSAFDYAAVQRFISTGHATEAKPVLEERLRLAPGDGRAHLLLGIVLSELNAPDAAETQFREAARLRPKDPAPHTNLGNLLASRGRLGQARSEFETALQLDPRDATSLSNLGAVQMSLQEYGPALKSFEAAVRVVPNDPRTLLGLFQAQRKLGLSGRANQTSDRLLTVRGVDEQAVQIVGALQGEAGEYAAAVRTFEKGARLFPESPAMAFNLGLALQKAGDASRAARVLEALRAKHDTAELESLLGAVFEQQRRFLDAVRSYQEAAEWEPGNESYRFDYASELLAHLNFEAARLVAEPAVQDFPESARLHVALGVALFGLERRDEAQALFLRVARQFPDDDLPLLYVSLCAESNGTALPESKQLLTSFYQRHPEQFMPAYLLGRWALDEGDARSAANLLQASIRLRGDYAPSRFQLGVALMQLDRTQEAIEQYRAAIKLDPQNSEIWYRLTLAYRKQGQAALASETEKEFRSSEESSAKRDAIQKFLYSTRK